MTNVIATARAGINVLTDIDPNNKIFDSRYNTFKILAQGVVSSHEILGSTTGDVLSIAHGQAQKPFVFLFIQWADGLVSMAMGTKKGTDNGFASIYNYDVLVNSTNIVLSFDNFDVGSEVINVAYIICEAPANN